MPSIPLLALKAVEKPSEINIPQLQARHHIHTCDARASTSFFCSRPRTRPQEGRSALKTEVNLAMHCRKYLTRARVRSKTFAA